MSGPLGVEDWEVLGLLVGGGLSSPQWVCTHSRSSEGRQAKGVSAATRERML